MNKTKMNKQTKKISKKSLVRLIRNDAKRLTKEEFFNELSNDYSSGNFTYSSLAQKYHISKKLDLEKRCNNPEGIAESIVGYALRELSDLTIQEIARKNSSRNLNTNGNYFAKIKPKELTDLSKKGVLKRGRIQISPQEKKDIHKMSRNPEYRTGKTIDYKKIAHKINEKYHKNQPTRTTTAIRNLLYKIKKESQNP